MEEEEEKGEVGSRRDGGEGGEREERQGEELEGTLRSPTNSGGPFLAVLPGESESHR